MWRAEAKLNIYESFFRSLYTIYTSSGPPVYTHLTLIFPTWDGLDSTAQLGKWEIKPGKLISDILNYEIFTFKRVFQFYFCNFFLANTDAYTGYEAEDERSSVFSTTDAASIKQATFMC